MKTTFTRHCCLLLLIAGITQSSHGAVTFTVSPTSTSNNYAGVITLQIGGLTTGASVVVQRFIDFNTNGVIDVNEPMMESIPLMDGAASIIGGATNYSVPYDQNPTNGAITTTLNFALPMNFENFTAPSIFKLISPTAQFTALTATFTVTNATQNQTISGTVSNGGSPATNVFVGANVQPSGGLVAATMTDNAGHYVFKLPVGIYQVLALPTNGYYNRSLAPTVTLTNGMSSTNNLTITNGTVSISGKVCDAANTNLGLGGILLLLQSGNNVAGCFSSSNGTYSVNVNPGFWTPKAVQPRTARTGYVFPRNVSQVDTTGGSKSNVNLLCPKVNALYYGRITDNSNHPFANIIFDGNDDNGNQGPYENRGFSDTNGNYGFGAYAETNGWNASPDPIENGALANYVVSQGTNVTFSNGQAVRFDFTVLPVIGQISGRVLDNHGNPVVGVELGSSANIGNNNYSSPGIDTDTNGYYVLPVAAGNWSVNFPATSNNQENPNTHNLEDLFGPYNVSVPPTNVVQNITLYPLGTAVLSDSAMSSPGEFDLNVTGTLFVTYSLDYSTDLVHWFQLYSFQLTSNPFPVSDFSATNRTKFYRVSVVNP